MIQLILNLASYAIPGFVRNWSSSPSSLDPLRLSSPEHDDSHRLTNYYLASTSASTCRDASIDRSILPVLSRRPYHPYSPLSPRATQDLLSRLEQTPPMLPNNFAQLITATSIAARLGIRSSSFIAELVVESFRYSTNTSVGLTRRALVSAVGSARANHALELGAKGFVDEHLDKGFLKMLDHYTNVGIYMVHNIFTLTELFAMAGFNLTHSAITTGFGAAEESVKTLERMFGSNESSRALSAIILLIRREFLHDPRFTCHSTLTGLAALTKAMTAFACLQIATGARTTSEMKMRVVWDTTVLAEVESKPFGAGAIDYELGMSEGRVLAQEAEASRQAKLAELAKLEPVSHPGLSPSREHPTDSGNVLASAARWTISRSDSHTTIRTPAEPVQLGPQASDEREEMEVDIEEISNEVELAGRQHRLRRSRSSVEIGTRSPALTEDVREALLRLARSQASEGSLDAFTSTHVQAGSSAIFEITTTITTTTSTTVRIVNSQPYSSSTLPYVESVQLGPVTVHSCTRPLEDTTGGYLDLPWSHPTVEALPTPSNRLRICSENEIDLSSGEPQASVKPALACPSCEPVSSRAPPPSPRPDRRKKIGLVMRTMTQKLTRRRTMCHLANLKDSTPGSVGLGLDCESAPALNFDEFAASADPKRVPTSKSLPSSPRPPIFRAFSKVAQKAFHSRSQTYSESKTLAAEMISRSATHTPPISSSDRCEEKVPNSDLDGCSATSIIADPDEEHSVKCSSALPRTPTRPRRSSAATHTTCITQAFSPDAHPPVSDFPPGPLVRNLAYFMRFSSAAYGQQFLRLMGLGRDCFNYPNTPKHSANHHAFASHVGLPVDQIILSSYADPGQPMLGTSVLSPLVHYVAVDHSMKAVVLTCRGTLGFSDVLTDLTCEYEPVIVEGGSSQATYLAHSGMLHSAIRLSRPSSGVHQCLRKALLAHPDYGLVITGHSLGGGVAALLALRFASPASTFVDQHNHAYAHPPIITRYITSVSSLLPPGRPIHSYTYGTPAVGSADLGSYMIGLVTSVCNGIDVVPTLSLGVLHDLKNAALTLFEESDDVAGEIVSKVVGLYRSQQQQSQNAKEGVGSAAEEVPELADWLWSLMRTIRAGSDAEKLYPPGEVWHVEKYEVFTEPSADDLLEPDSELGMFGEIGESMARVTRNMFGLAPDQPKGFKRRRMKKEARRVILSACEDIAARFSEPIFGKSMFHDHLPTQYEHALGLLEQAVDPNSKAQQADKKKATETEE
ncbi:hypothetical protein CROQUDRAFT_717865 [Cronartium quercuum f. sp. fusiforme G11]|uniref:sn-1-specific diacylglycerol lipase n=1 Tax=Cronartium quercuum f. sp. fusiforme G11 TaxID=708437 RepID=A0A9P6NE90_9BASI|nr:hypothetical protein CROQUDRAFT_717865 [Cronartium quercuum f. sp. fusiforme G11]